MDVSSSSQPSTTSVELQTYNDLLNYLTNAMKCVHGSATKRCKLDSDFVRACEVHYLKDRRSDPLNFIGTGRGTGDWYDQQAVEMKYNLGHRPLGTFHPRPNDEELFLSRAVEDMMVELRKDIRGKLTQASWSTREGLMLHNLVNRTKVVDDVAWKLATRVVVIRNTY